MSHSFAFFTGFPFTEGTATGGGPFDGTIVTCVPRMETASPRTSRRYGSDLDVVFVYEGEGSDDLARATSAAIWSAPCASGETNSRRGSPGAKQSAASE